LPARALAITFDDGYADNATVAFPILREFGLPATVFVSTAFLDGGRMWNDTIIETLRRVPGPEVDLSAAGLGRHRVDTPSSRRSAIATVIRAIKHLPTAERGAKVEAVRTGIDILLPDDLMLTSAALRTLAGEGAGIGAHTVHHPILTSLSEADAVTEIAGSRDALEAIVKQPVRLFAYPNGRPNADYRRDHVRIVRQAGFAAAFSTSGGAARMHDSAFELPRFTPWDRTRSRWAVRLARNYFSRVVRAGA
jgi:peptidoglycan/xylan/chitin deacetylase (PgdA/CDA1 family)